MASTASDVAWATACPAPLAGFPSANWCIQKQLIHAGYPGASDAAVSSSIRQAIRGAAVTTIVCLQPESELHTLPAYMVDGIEALPSTISWLHFPVIDGSIAVDDELRALIERCLALLAKGDVLLVHCLGGHGRSGVVCACLAGALLGLSAPEALIHVKAAHDTREDPWAAGHRSPDTEEQVEQVSRMLAAGGCAYCRAASQIKGGLNNSLYRLAPGVVLKLYGPGTAHLTDRLREREMMHMLRLASPDGALSKRLLAALPGGHGHFEEWIEGTPMPFAQMVNPHGEGIATLLGRLHSTLLPAHIADGAEERFWGGMASWASALPDAWPACATAPGRSQLLLEVAWLRESGAVAPSPVTIIHKDVHGGNLLVQSDGRLQLIDLEFADAGPRAFDVANFFLECAFVEEDESWDWSRLPTATEQARFATAYATAYATANATANATARVQMGDGTAKGGVPAADEGELATEALLTEWSTGWPLVAHLWNILWALSTADATPAASVSDEMGFDYLGYATVRYERYLYEKRLAVRDATR